MRASPRGGLALCVVLTVLLPLVGAAEVLLGILIVAMGTDLDSWNGLTISGEPSVYLFVGFGLLTGAVLGGAAGLVMGWVPAGRPHGKWLSTGLAIQAAVFVTVCLAGCFLAALPRSRVDSTLIRHFPSASTVPECLNTHNGTLNHPNREGLRHPNAR